MAAMTWIHVVLFCLQIPHAYLLIENLAPEELLHLFGATDGKGTSFSLFTPVKSSHRNGTIFTIDYLNQRYVFLLFPTLIYDVQFNNNQEPCIYQGIGLSHPGSRLALVDCTGGKRGLVITAEGDILLFHPIPRSEGNNDHIIHKRDSWHLRPEAMNVQDAVKNTTCLFDSQTHWNSQSSRTESRLAVLQGALTVELALFADQKLWRHFQQIYGSTKAENELHSFILAVVNNVNLLFNHHSLEPKIQLKIKRYQVIKDPPALLQDQAHNSGDVDILLDNFCQYQASFNALLDSDPSHWDHALLFTGYDLYRGSLKTVAGYAPVKGMCTGASSCTINEGLDFGSVFVITHEMGHSLGMFHDGDNGCDAGCCIMSPSVGAGKTTWSTCSVREFNQFLNEMGTGSLPPNCLLDGGNELSIVDYSAGEYPGQKYNADQQCRLYHGSCWSQELREGQTLEEICAMVWCGEGEGVIRTAHPALEGTYCGENKWCLQGSCRPWPSTGIPPPSIHGSWTAWNDSPNDGCQLNCDAPCLVNGQLMIRRSIRLCENPAVNNGGKACDGSPYRGFICSDDVCNGPTANEYASTVCSNLRDGIGPGGTAIAQLTGHGFQHAEQPCRIWCQLFSGSFARSVGNFPDGTPCKDDHFCVRGRCMKRSCGGSVLVSHEEDCPSPSGPSFAVWSEWSECSVTCGRGGRRKRTRDCPTGSCKGSSSQLQPCHSRIRCGTVVTTITDQVHEQRRFFVSVWLQWSQWSHCDASCGQGLQQRRRECSGNQCAGSSLQSKPCELAPCTDTGIWSNWSEWSDCNVSCGDGGLRYKRRYCSESQCPGSNVSFSNCDIGQCPEELDATESLSEEDGFKGTL